MRVLSGLYQYRVYLFVGKISRANSSLHISVFVVYIAFVLVLYTLSVFMMIIYGLTGVNYGVPELMLSEVVRNEL